MSTLVLVFLTALHANSLLLMVLADTPLGRPIMGGKGLLAFASLALLAAWMARAGAIALPATIPAYLLALGFSSVLLAFAGSLAVGLPQVIPRRLRRLRASLPVLVAILATLSFSLLQPAGQPSPGAALLLCAASAALAFAAVAVMPALRERLNASDPPVFLRGAPVDILCAGFVALAAMGVAGSLPW